MLIKVIANSFYLIKRLHSCITSIIKLIISNVILLLDFYSSDLILFPQ